jgi:hypothetical protein
VSDMEQKSEKGSNDKRESGVTERVRGSVR